MSKKEKEIDKGDFGLPRRQELRNQIVAIYDLVGFTSLKSNKELLGAVREIEHELQVDLWNDYEWDEKMKGVETYDNTILLRSTGDGYIIAFSELEDDMRALRHLTNIHNAIRRKHGVRLGVNKGENYVVRDINERVNIIGWGINLAARALRFAEKNQIICTAFFAEPFINTFGEEYQATMIKIGRRRIKNSRIVLYNYFRKGEFGGPLMRSQRQGR